MFMTAALAMATHYSWLSRCGGGFGGGVLEHAYIVQGKISHFILLLFFAGFFFVRRRYVIVNMWM
jgi:hypothetical protein